MKIITCTAPVNIAVIKYWGKRDETLILPINDSLSATLSTDVMCAKTTIMASPLLKENKFWLNGVKENFDNDRLTNCLKSIKKRCKSDLPHLNWKLSICSKNNFPTAAGLASSAAGYACLVSALAALYGIEGDISDIARQGSGSACRSVYGGWVHWFKGDSPTGEDSIAKPLAPAGHWPEMRIIVLVNNNDRKKCSSTSGMKTSVETSSLLNYRAQNVVPKQIQSITKAILERDFHTFAEITMKESNQLHAVCLDTYPPCVYMNDTSHAIADLVHSYNRLSKENKVAYTFDAGSNACLFLLESEVEEFFSIVNYVFPKCDDIPGVDYLRGLPLQIKPIQKDMREKLGVIPNHPGMLKYIIHTKVGEGPKISTNPLDHLLLEDGSPKCY